MWTPELSLALALAIPAIGGVFVALLGSRPNLREAATLIAAVLLAFNVAYLVEVAQSQPTLNLATLAPGLHLVFKLEPLGAVFAAVASGLWIVNSLYSIGYMRGNNEKNQTRFYVCFCIAIAGAMGVALSGNLLTMFLFYEVLTLSTYPLVTHKGDAKAKRGGAIYLSILLGTSIGLLLPAVIATHFLAGSTDFMAGGLLALNEVTPAISSILLVLFAFGIGKAALMPVHPWLPNAMVAPTPVSALLHAVAVVKAGVFAMLKVGTYIFGPALIAITPAADALAWIAGISIVLASVVAMTKDNLKARLAFSTVSQLSYVTLGVMLGSPLAMLGGALQIVMHAWGKITLFMSAGAIYTATGKTEISQMDGLGRYMPWLFGAYTVGALSIIGLPPLGGSWPKLFLLQGAWDSGQGWLMVALIASSILNVAYLLPLSARGFFSPPEQAQLKRQPPMMVILPPVITALGVIVLFFLIGPLRDYLEPVFMSSTLAAEAAL
ncbi:proton-conducting transporter membrane subunit [Maricaulis sp.]|jgi:multicomponent Na+:H+ antiporter subunit D|uniref:proton-conducting transporter transmembrane domain-containing protein n=1 Tax=Maricaulis sp. TaxID=1486257 RepID=UPI0025E54662|nr:proton-conducting transporter membrane subunit [Maricaulis sp.]MDF1769377.1 proton-conducting transporter membrane subunit [Maricaulis sp.]